MAGQICNRLKVLTSDELPSEWDRIVYSEAALRANSKAVLFLIKANMADFIRATRSRLSHDLLLFLSTLSLKIMDGLSCLLNRLLYCRSR